MRRPRFLPYFWLVIILLTLFRALIGLNRIGVAYIFPVIVPERAGHAGRPAPRRGSPRLVRSRDGGLAGGPHQRPPGHPDVDPAQDAPRVLARRGADLAATAP